MIEFVDLIQKLSQEIKVIFVYLQQLEKTRLEGFKKVWIDEQEVIQILRIKKRTLQTLRNNGTLPHSRINGKFYYKLSDIESLLEANYSPSNSNKS